VPSDDEFSIMEGFLGVPADSLTYWGWRGVASQIASNQLKSAPPDGRQEKMEQIQADSLLFLAVTVMV
jgi:hypothetical protein